MARKKPVNDNDIEELKTLLIGLNIAVSKNTESLQRFFLLFCEDDPDGDEDSDTSEQMAKRLFTDRERHLLNAVNEGCN